MIVSLRASLMANFIVDFFNPFAWLLIGLLLYSLSKQAISVGLKLFMIALYIAYCTFHLYLSIFLGGMAGGAPGTPEIYATVLTASIISFIGLMGTGLVYVLIKR